MSWTTISSLWGKIAVVLVICCCCLPAQGIYGDGMGNALDYPRSIAVDDSGNAYVTGSVSDNAFKITSDGLITEIIDATGDSMGNEIDYPWGITVDDSGNAYVTGSASDNAFKITSDGLITEIIDSTGDGMGNALHYPRGIAVDDSGNAYVTGSVSNNAFRITPDGVITEIIYSTNVVDFQDFAAVASKWREVDCSEPDWSTRADIDFSGNVGFSDLRILTENWLD